uniref:Transmembrane protein n=2 Tax=Ditylum brightwellii TaxID=49249 RepID=A0A6V2QB68_9STRA|mmetsp:Transcript_1057/g.1721  ORF Transcript_1057/g.1721 Transcript_1057/m.1721 type:complete len:235 (-) Transcript_1057:619-1323(-)
MIKTKGTTNTEHYTKQLEKMATMTKHPRLPLALPLKQPMITSLSATFQSCLFVQLSTKATSGGIDAAGKTSSSASTTTVTTAKAAPESTNVGKIMDRKVILQQKKILQKKQRESAAAAAAKPPSSLKLFVKAGLPLILFSIGSAFVLKSALEGKTKERDASKGAISKSERQARMEAEKDDMMEKLNKKMKQDFDNTKRIERPEEILERRRLEREKRNRWYNRLGRLIVGGGGSK